jgi:hypothetical protein
MPDARKKRKKESFMDRMRRRSRETVDLTGTLVHEPRSFPRKLLAAVRRSLRIVWHTRGGGFYATGFVLTFAWLELRMLVNDIVEAESVSDFFGEQLFEMLFRYLGESFQNTIQAIIWPVHVITISEYGIFLLIAVYLAFTYGLQARIERWLFDDDDQAPADTSEG